MFPSVGPDGKNAPVQNFFPPMLPFSSQNYRLLKFQFNINSETAAENFRFSKNSVFLLLCRKTPFRRAAFCTDRSLCREARRKGSHFFTAYFSVCLTFFHRHKLRLIHQRMLKPDGSGIRTFHHAASAVITFSRKHHHRRSALF